jgi:acyl CoA:acetate/3-ketoacid CoA transferase alpha subunit
MGPSMRPATRAGGRSKTVAGPARAVADVPPGASVGVGGFGLSGDPETEITVLRDLDVPA